MSGQYLMSLQEADQITIFEKLEAGQLKQCQAAQALGLSVRQVRCKLRRYRRKGTKGLIHLSSTQYLRQCVYVFC